MKLIIGATAFSIEVPRLVISPFAIYLTTFITKFKFFDGSSEENKITPSVSDSTSLIKAQSFSKSSQSVKLTPSKSKSIIGLSVSKIPITSTVDL